MQPTIGRIVLYTNLGDKEGRFPPEVHPLLVTAVGERDQVSGLCFYGKPDSRSHGVFFMDNVDFAGEGALAGFEAARGKWAWPVVR